MFYFRFDFCWIYLFYLQSYLQHFSTHFEYPRWLHFAFRTEFALFEFNFHSRVLLTFCDSRLSHAVELLLLLFSSQHFPLFLNWFFCYLLFAERDLIILITTFVSCLYFGVEIGLLIGVLGNLIHLLYVWARPNIKCDKCKVSN